RGSTTVSPGPCPATAWTCTRDWRRSTRCPTSRATTRSRTTRPFPTTRRRNDQEHGMIKSRPGDEGRHEPDTGTYWNESWYFDFSRADGTGGDDPPALYPPQPPPGGWAHPGSPR